MNLRIVYCLLLIVVGANAEAIRFNQTQVIGTHNSYHLAPAKEALKLIGLFSKRGAEAWAYSRKPLDQQLEAGIRQFELDVFADPKGGLFGSNAEMKKPGMKVMHVPGIDEGTVHPTLIGALTAVEKWSKAHPSHVPVMILIELKDRAQVPFAPKPVPFDREQMEALELEVRKVFREEHLITPDQIRGESTSLREAVLKKGWPELDELRGKVMFCLDNEGRHREVYLKGNPTLEKRLMFVSVPKTNPAAAWMKRNDPVGSFEEIKVLVSEGFLVRTRADAETREARSNDVKRRDLALSSGAQFVSTDFPKEDPGLSEYAVRLPGKVVARINPVSGGKHDQKGELE
ncbi:phosphatidylinositol-specific phospholipase C1-like protein [Akkermansiaceae bacterium]|nr:phosphatidylinositol-specific phospholipase C1-like protein [Akkermansiaceae bacterium]